eukprot:4151604-Pleurochrysis_carterae.AAC.2
MEMREILCAARRVTCGEKGATHRIETRRRRRCRRCRGRPRIDIPQEMRRERVAGSIRAAAAAPRGKMYREHEKRAQTPCRREVGLQSLHALGEHDRCNVSFLATPP